MGVQISPCMLKRNLRGKDMPGHARRHSAVSCQKRLNRPRCRFGCGLLLAQGNMCYMGCTLAPPGEYDSTVHIRRPCKNGWTDRDAVWNVNSGGPKEPCIRWDPVRIAPCQGAILGERTCPGMPHNTLPWVVQKWLNGSRCRLTCRLGYRHKEACVKWSAHWRYLADTVEPSMCGDDAAFLSNYFNHLFTLVILLYHMYFTACITRWNVPLDLLVSDGFFTNV